MIEIHEPFLPVKMRRIIQTEHLHYDSLTGRVYRRCGGYIVVPSIGKVNEMPQGLGIDLMQEWSDIADVICEEFFTPKE